MANKILFFIMCLILSCKVLDAQENAVLSNIKNDKLKSYPLNQRLFLHLNKSIYKDTDTIWVKGYSIQGPLQQLSDISQTMIVALLNSNNDVVISKQFLIFKGIAEGQIPLPKSINKGMYQLVAYGSNMLNDRMHQFFRATIEIVASKPAKYNFSFGFNQPFFQQDDIVDMQVLTYDAYYKPLSGIKLKYDIWDGDKKIDEGKIEANTKGIASIKIPFSPPDKAKSPLKISIQGGNPSFPTVGDTYVHSGKQALDVQILPEGGNLVAGLMQMVAFRSVDDLGKPVAISGEVINSKGESLTNFNTMHQGMGKFMLIPEHGENYTLHIQTPTTHAREVPFPEVLDKGFVLMYKGMRKKKAYFNLSKNFEGVENITAVWQMDGIILASQSFSLQNEQLLKFNTAGVPTGIAKLTLFDQQGHPFAERLVFNQSSKSTNVAVSLNQTRYMPRNKVAVSLTTTSDNKIPEDANLSVSITHIANGIHPSYPIPDVRDYTLFKSELSGSVYQPWQYFDAALDSLLRQYQIDLLMLTHGWRKLEWYDDLCEKLDDDCQYFNYDLYRGLVTKGNEAVPHAKVEVFSFGRSIETTFSEADENGRFWVKPEFIERSSPSIIITTEKKNVLSRAKLNIDDCELEIRDSIVKTFHDELMPFVYRYNVEVYHQEEDIDTLFKIWETKYIDEITVIGKRQPSQAEQTLQRFSTGSTRLLQQEDFGGVLSDMESLVNTLGFGLYVEDNMVVRTSQGELKPVSIVVDDIQIRNATFSDIAYLSSDMIDAIAFVKGGTVSYEFNGASAGALMVWTSKTKNIVVEQTEKRNKFTSNRYGQVLTFYKPKYDTPKLKADPAPDKRVCLYWNNTLRTDSLGKASFVFYTGDLKGEYLINIQGISKKNGPVFKETRFTVH